MNIKAKLKISEFGVMGLKILDMVGTHIFLFFLFFLEKNIYISPFEMHKLYFLQKSWKKF